jgi:hypothetical protein
MNHFGLFDSQVHPIQRVVSGISEDFAALLALIALAITALTKLPAFGTAIVTRRRLNQKRDIHARLVKTLSQLESEKLHMLAIRSEELVARPPEEIKEVEVAIGQLIGEVRELEALAIFCTKETISALHTYFDASHYGAARGRERLRKEIERLGQARSGAILAAQKDLGIEPGT